MKAACHLSGTSCITVKNPNSKVGGGGNNVTDFEMLTLVIGIITLTFVIHNGTKK